MKIVEEYKKKYPRIIKLLESTQNLGAAKNFLRTLASAKGEFIAYCDGDDYWVSPHKLRTQIDLMRRFSACNISFHPCYEFLEDQAKPQRIMCRHADKEKVFSTTEVILGGGGFMPSGSIVFKTKILQGMPDWFNEFPLDYFLQILASTDTGALFFPDVFSVYRRCSVGSWSASHVKNPNRVIDHYLRTFDYLAKLDRELKFRYSKAIAWQRGQCIREILKECRLPIGLKNKIFSNFKNELPLVLKLSWYFLFKRKLWKDLYQFKHLLHT